jgi:hypothetical protein
LRKQAVSLAETEPCYIVMKSFVPKEGRKPPSVRPLVPSL